MDTGPEPNAVSWVYVLEQAYEWMAGLNLRRRAAFPFLKIVINIIRFKLSDDLESSDKY